MLTHFIGEFAALTAALLWAFASILFQRLGEKISPLVLNFFKAVVAIAMLVPVLIYRHELWIVVDLTGFILLLLSGVIGIGIGDTAFFASLNRLGPRRAVLLVETLAPPAAAMLALIVLQEILSILAVLGIFVTVTGVAWVIVERTPNTTRDRQAKLGLCLGVAAALCQAIGAVISRSALIQTGVTPLWSTLIRLLGGMLVLLIWIPLVKRPLRIQYFRSVNVWGLIIVATFFGTFLGIFFQQVALKYTDAGIAQTLLATSSLFVLPLVFLKGEKISSRAFLGALLAVFGVGMIFGAK